jgi:hypothetical protein
MRYVSIRAQAHIGINMPSQKMGLDLISFRMQVHMVGFLRPMKLSGD